MPEREPHRPAGTRRRTGPWPRRPRRPGSEPGCRKIKELFYKDRARVQLTKISQFGLMEISRQRIGQSTYETFYQKCECCNGNGLKKTKTIRINYHI